jgi:Mrp family chromosome partitioning ATPase
MSKGDQRGEGQRGRGGPGGPRRPLYTGPRTPVASSMPSLSPKRDEGAFAPYTRAVRRHPWLVAGITVLGLLVALGWVAKRQVQYQATAQILVTPVSTTDVSGISGLPLLSDSVDPTRTLETAATVLASPKAAAVAATKLGAGWSAARISNTVTVVPLGDSNIIAVNAKEPSAADAVAAANAAANAALLVRAATLRTQVDIQLASAQARRTTLVANGADATTLSTVAGQIAALEQIRGGTDPNFQLQQPAGGAAATGKSAKLILLLGLVCGLLIGTGAALLLEQLDRRVRDEEDLQETFPLPVLARVPVSRRRGGDGDPSTMPEPGIREAFRTLQVQLEEPGEGSRVVMLTSASMGDGKTTAAINLARALVAAGHRVVLLDFDLRKPDVGARLGVSSDVLGLFRSNVRLSDLLVPVPSTRALKVLSAPPRGDISPVLEALSRRLPELLAQARELADYVVIDTAPLGRVSDALRIAASADDVLLVARPGNTDGKELALAREQLEHMGIYPTGMVVVGSSGAGRSDYYGYVADSPLMAPAEPSAAPLAKLRSAAPAAQAQRRDRGERLP